MKAGVFDPGSDSDENVIRLSGAVGAAPSLTELEVKENLTRGAKICSDTVAFFDEVYCRMAKRELEMVDSTKKHVSVLKERANAVSEALARIDKMMGSDFEVRLQRLERFAAAVETLDALSRSGKVEAIVMALK